MHATSSMEAMKGKASVASSTLLGSGVAAAGAPIRNIVFACDAGMGSSAMGASVLRKKVHGAGFTDVTVVNKAISNLTDTYDLVVSHQDLTDRARQKTGSAVHVSVENFMDSPRYDEIVELVARTNSGTSGGAVAADDPAGLDAHLLATESVVLHGSGTTSAEAIAQAGELLVASGAVDASYVEAMHEREKSVSTYMGNLLAIPHGTNEAKPSIRRSAISFVRYPDGIDWKGKEVKFVIGIAAMGDDHLKLLGRIAEIFLDADQVARLEAASTPADVQRDPGRRPAGLIRLHQVSGPVPAHPSRSRAAAVAAPNTTTRNGARSTSSSTATPSPRARASKAQPGPSEKTWTATRAASRATGIRSATRSTTGRSRTRGGTESPNSLSR